MADHPAIGIDLGTTHSLVAVYENGNARVLKNPLGQALTPSVVAMDDDGMVLVGAPAAERLRAGKAQAYGRFKADMGTDKVYQLGSRRLTATGLSGLVLADMKATASERLGCPIHKAVITVPAYFREPERRATIQAAALAGLEVEQLINEPTAAAIFDGLADADEPKVVAVADLGGGTFDLTLLELYDGVADVLASMGDTRLGGEDATDALVRWANQKLDAPPIDPDGRARLREAAEQAKRRLSTEDDTTLSFGNNTIPISQEDAQAAFKPFVFKLRQCMQSIRGQQGFVPPDEVLLVGGAARMPSLSALASEVFPTDQPPQWRDGDHAIALGAAMAAGLHQGKVGLQDHMVSDVLTHSLGVATTKDVDGHRLFDRFDPILSRGTTLPTSKTSWYHTLHHEQTEVLFRIFEGEQRIASENQQLGEIKIDKLPILPQGQRHDLQVRFTHDASGLFEVECRPAGGEWRQLVLQRAGTELEKEDLEQRLQSLSGLKISPRELLPNRFALEQANRLCAYLTGDVREQLEHTAERFEVALDHHDLEHQQAMLQMLTHTTQRIAAQMGISL